MEEAPALGALEADVPDDFVASAPFQSISGHNEAHGELLRVSVSIKYFFTPVCGTINIMRTTVCTSTTQYYYGGP